MSGIETHTLDVDGTKVTYDVRGDLPAADGRPPLMLIGSPMGAAGFVTLAGHFADRTVVTYDPRGAERSRRTDGAAESTPEEHADDLHRGDRGARRRAGRPVRQQRRRRERAGPGRAPPGAGADARRPRAAAGRGAARPRGGAGRGRATSTTPTSASGMGPAMAKFIAHRQPPGPDHGRLPRPARAGPGDVRPADRGRRLARRCAARAEHASPAPTTSPTSRPSETASTRIVVAVGAESEGELAHRGGEASPSGWARSRSRSPATTAGSWAASTARRVSPSRSRRSCARCSQPPEEARPPASVARRSRHPACARRRKEGRNHE